MNNDWKKRTLTRQEHVDLFDTWFSEQPKEAQHLINDYIADKIQKSFKMGKSLLNKQIEEIENLTPSNYRTPLQYRKALLTKLKQSI